MNQYKNDDSKKKTKDADDNSLKNKKKSKKSLEELAASNLSEAEMMKALGLPVSGFDSSKGKEADEASAMSGVRVKSKRQYRQYMNRRGGFNRPLSKSF